MSVNRYPPMLNMSRRLYFPLNKANKMSLSHSTNGQRSDRSQSSPTDWNSHAPFFDYTRGRFLVNEAHEMAIRHVQFNMNEFAKRAAEAVGLDPTQCVQVDKFPDGMFNKTFLFTMDNGAQVVGKVPNPNAGRPHYTTASEVATMDFVRMIELVFISVLMFIYRSGIGWGHRCRKYWHGAQKQAIVRLGLSI